MDEEEKKMKGGLDIEPKDVVWSLFKTSGQIAMYSMYRRLKGDDNTY
ncbi:MAG: hypothetical protein MJ072_01835 [Clostridia bacterium]|nr:hypothetical protein [Clostridia bacterium]